jgi:hypothetical protein
MQTGRCFELNRVGAEVWALLASPTAVSELCEHLASRYRVDRDLLARDVTILVGELLKEQLVDTSGPVIE